MLLFKNPAPKSSQFYHRQGRQKQFYSQWDGRLQILQYLYGLQVSESNFSASDPTNKHIDLLNHRQYMFHLSQKMWKLCSTLYSHGLKIFSKIFQRHSSIASAPTNFILSGKFSKKIRNQPKLIIHRKKTKLKLH